MNTRQSTTPDKFIRVRYAVSDIHKMTGRPVKYKSPKIVTAKFYIQQKIRRHRPTDESVRNHIHSVNKATYMTN